MSGDAWKLFWVQEQSEVYAARSAEEARAFVAGLTGEPVPVDEVGEVEVKPGVMGMNDDNGRQVDVYDEWQKVKAEGIEKPFQFWSAYL